MTRETRELSINQNLTAEFAAENINDDPVNLDEGDAIHVMGMIVALLPPESNDKSPIPRNIVSNAQRSKLS